MQTTVCVFFFSSEGFLSEQMYISFDARLMRGEPFFLKPIYCLPEMFQNKIYMYYLKKEFNNIFDIQVYRYT